MKQISFCCIQLLQSGGTFERAKNRTLSPLFLVLARPQGKLDRDKSHTLMAHRAMKKRATTTRPGARESTLEVKHRQWPSIVKRSDGRSSVRKAMDFLTRVCINELIYDAEWQ